jgi:hypothetical protein
MIGHWRALAASLALAALAVPGGAAAQEDEGFSERAQRLASCAGAVAAYSGFNVLEYPAGAEGDLAPLLGAILEQLNRERGLEGMTGRDAANAARAYWAGRSRSALEARISDCRTRFGGGQ